MTKKTIVRKGMYFDSVKLMLVTNELNLAEGVREAAVVMGTDLNKESLERTGLLTEEADKASVTDMIIGIEAESEEAIDSALAKLDELLKGRTEEGAQGEYRPKSLDMAIIMQPDSNMVIISVPGRYAKEVAKDALLNNLNVMMFSDNVTLEDELELKELAVAKDLLMMGPDCGTALVNGVPLCFSNNVREGRIGIVAASGTGAQEVMTLIHKMGGGITQVLGTGGRDLSEAIGGRMMLLALKALNEDPATEVITVISKPPADSVSRKMLEYLKTNVHKPVVINFLGAEFQNSKEENLSFESTLEGAARKSVEAAGYGEVKSRDEVLRQIEEISEREASMLAPNQRYVRGLYSGGTLAYESLFTLEKSFGTVYSNLSKKNKVKDVYNLVGHSTVDFGEDEFTNGRPHPMIDTTLRHEVFRNVLQDEETGVIVMDIVLGYGSHIAPHKVFVESLRKHNSVSSRHVAVVAGICGTEDDVQDYSTVKAELEEEGVVVMDSNFAAVQLASRIIEKLKGE